MDYSMFLKRKRNQVLTTAYTNNASANNPIFNRDKKTRGFDNGVLTVLFERGLIVGSGSSSRGTTYTATYTVAAGVEGPDFLVAAGLPIEVLNYFLTYDEKIQAYPGTPINQTTLSNFQSVAPITFTVTNNTTSETSTLTYIGDPATDKAAAVRSHGVTPNIGDSVTMTLTFG